MTMMPISAFNHARDCPARVTQAQCACNPEARRFKVHLYSWPIVDVIAKSHAQARYAVFRAMCEAGFQRSLRDMHEFLVAQSPRAWVVDWSAPYELENSP